MNSHHYFLEWAFIVDQGLYYRLFVIHKGLIKFDSVFESLESAMKSFDEEFASRSRREDTRPWWSPFYEPEVEWINWIAGNNLKSA